MKKAPELYTATRRGTIAHVQLQRIERRGRIYLYLQWKSGSRPRRYYLGVLA